MNLSVALCTYNGAAYLPAQLASLTTQTQPPAELVVCDDRSADDTRPTLERFAATAPFPVRVQINEANLGSTGNFEQAVSLCTGDIIALCDQDDVWHPDKLARVEAAFAADSAVGLVLSDAEMVGAGLQPLGYRLWESLPFTGRMQAALEAGDAARALLTYNVVTGAAAAFRADLRELVLPIPPCWVHDGWIGFIAAAVSRVALIREPLIRYRRHHAQQIGAEQLTLARQIRTARRRDADYFRRTAECYTVLADRLARFPHRLRSTGLVDVVRRKAAHSLSQARMRDGPRVGRLAPAVRELVRGHYHAYSHGLKGFAADLLL